MVGGHSLQKGKRKVIKINVFHVCMYDILKNILKNIRQVSPSSKTKYLKSKFNKVFLKLT